MTQYQAVGRRQPPKPVFAAATAVLFVLSFSAADSIGFVPCSVDDTCTASSVALSDLPQLGSSVVQDTPTALPERIVIPEIAMDLPVQNSPSRDLATLYEQLKDGPIRYVDSARLGEQGNVLVFGHSSRLPVVRNQMYKAFNRIPELKPGALITVSGGGRSFLYSVVSVEQADINDPTAVVDLGTHGKQLTLVTCDTQTGKTARFVLKADFVGEL